MRRLIWLFLGALAAAMVYMIARRDMGPNGDFELVVFNRDWHQLSLGYAADPAQATLAALGPDATLVALGAADIEDYAWDTQTLTLSAAATERLIDAVAGLKPRSDGVAALNALKQRLSMGSALERALYLQGFAVRLDGAPMYGGIFLDATSQMGIDFPVARVSLADGKARIALLPLHIPFAQADPVGADGAIGPAVIVDEAKDDVSQLNKDDAFYDTWMLSIASSETAVRFRARIRDPRVKALFAGR